MRKNGDITYHKNDVKSPTGCIRSKDFKYHWAAHRIHAHVALSVLALLLERVIEQACGDTWRNIRADLDRIKLAQLSSPNGEVWQVTEATPEATNHLKSLDLRNPPAILHLN